MSHKTITIKSFNGIGDLLFLTPSFRVIKQAYPDSAIIVNTHRRSLLSLNPFVDRVSSKAEGLFCWYSAPDSKKKPTQHHILDDWNIICKHYDLHTEIPDLVPSLYINHCDRAKRNNIGVQVMHKKLYHKKRIWPHFADLSNAKGFEPIPEIKDGDVMMELVRVVASYKLVVCAEGGISHIRAALGLPAIVLMGGFTRPEWVGYSFHYNLVSRPSCSPCFNMSPCSSFNPFMCWEKFSFDYVKHLAMREAKG